jgi:DNA polymerase II large subunit
MMATSGFVSIGTQLKYERPGKGTVVTPCHDIQGPYIQFNDGSAKRVQSRSELELMLPNEVGYDISKVWDLGELLVPVGEFLENNHPLLPSPYVPEWHRELLANRGIVEANDFVESLAQSKIYQVPLHPDYVAVGWQDLSALEAHTLLTGLSVDATGTKVKCPEDLKELVYRLNINIDKDGCLWGAESYLVLNLLARITAEPEWHDGTGLDYINQLADFEIKPRTTYRIGARMGKPEGSKMRDMKPSKAHGLFPVGDNGGVQKLINNALEKEGKVGVSKRFCAICDEETYWPVCRGIGDKSHDPEPTRFHEKQWVAIDYKGMWDQALERCKLEGEAPPKVKGVKGLRNNEMIMEPLDKALLRAKHGVSVFRDGTIRFDMVDITMTHFKPSEVGMTLEQAHALGYLVDSVEDVVELFPQDVVIPENCADDLVNVCKFTDDELDFIYGQERYYGVEKPEDLIGQMIMGIAPHTSGAILGRIIGFTSVKGHYGHPFYHAAKRRNCDGDIDAIIMLTEGLLNFSRQFLPRSRGGQMDAPLILTMGINASEIDKEALNVETCWKYPEAFFELTQGQTENGNWRPAQAKESTQFVEIVEARLGTDQEAVGFGYTHGTDNANDGPEWNPYNDKQMKLSMRQKTMAQFALGEVLHSVDNERQSAKLIDTHLIRDMRGNLRAFGQQKIRCTKCGRSYRRVPISGKCMEVSGSKTDPFSGESVEIKCPGNLVMTVSQGAVSKYDALMRDIIAIYGCDAYISQLYSSVSMWVAQTFEDRSVGSQQRLW